jgi:hypothetical protein
MKLEKLDMRNLKTWFAEQCNNDENEHLEQEIEAVEDALSDLIKKLRY